MSDCAHATWVPIQGWYGRYRCVDCSALAYRGLVSGCIDAPAEKLVLYKCQRKGCPDPAVTHKDRQFCQKHHEEYKQRKK